jgi:hypothetical protein
LVKLQWIVIPSLPLAVLDQVNVAAAFFEAATEIVDVSQEPQN